MSIHRGIRIRALAIAIACALTSAAAHAQPAPGSAGRPRETVTGTISRVDSRTGTFDLLTGVGHAIRVRRIRYPADLKVMARRAQAGLSALVPGTVCRVECEIAGSGATATGVEVLNAAPARTP
jgi:hypothetical protein